MGSLDGTWVETEHDPREILSALTWHHDIHVMPYKAPLLHQEEQTDFYDKANCGKFLDVEG